MESERKSIIERIEYILSAVDMPTLKEIERIIKGVVEYRRRINAKR